MANALLRDVCVPGVTSSRVTSTEGFRNILHSHALAPRKACRPLRSTVVRPSKVQAHATEAPAKSKARPGEKKGAVHAQNIFLIDDWRNSVSGCCELDCALSPLSLNI